MTCPICEKRTEPEHLSDGYLLCGGCGYAVKLDAAGALVGWATTSKSHPRGIWEVGKGQVAAPKRVTRVEREPQTWR